MSAAKAQVAPLLAVTHVRKSFGSLAALEDISLSLGCGKVLGLVGSAGAGKSTMLRCIHRSETIDQGTISLDGEVVAAGRDGPGATASAVARQVAVTGMVPQRLDLPEHMTALQIIIEGPLTLLKRPRKEIVAEATALLACVGLADRRDAYPGELSGGQRQRLAIGRALAMRPKLMLLDDPLIGLEPDEAGAVLALTRRLAAEGMSVIVAARQPGLLRELADDLVFMDGGGIVGLAGPAGLP